MSDKIINGIDVSEYFIDVVDEGGSTIDYKILPNSERLLAEKIFEQNQQLKRLQEENKELKEKAPMKLIAKNNKYRSALKEISILAKNYCNACDEFKAKTFKNKNDCLYCNYGFIRRKINEVLNDRD